MKVLRIIQALRLQEIAIKTGFILIGSAFVLSEVGPNQISVLFELFLISLLSGLAIYAFNAFYGYVPDQENDRLNTLSIISQRSFGLIAIIAMLVVLIWMFTKSLYLFYVSLAVFVFWTVYVHPSINLKGRPGGGILVAFVAQLFHFRIGALYAGGEFFSAFWPSIYFALIFASGHIWHELIDWEADKKSGVRTTAIVLGKYRSIWLAELFFVISTILWFTLGLIGSIEVELITPYVLAYILQKLVFYGLKIHKSQASQRILLFRKVYLAIFFFATCAVLWPKIDLLGFLTLIM